MDGVFEYTGICADATSGVRIESRQSSRIGYYQRSLRIIRWIVDGDEKWLESVLAVAALHFLKPTPLIVTPGPRAHHVLLPERPSGIRTSPDFTEIIYSRG